MDDNSLGVSGQSADIAFSSVSTNTLIIKTNYVSATNRITLSPGTVATLSVLGSGNVGIGTTSPVFENTTSGSLHLHNVNTGALTELHLTNGNSGATATDGGVLQLGSGGGLYLWNRENNNISFGTNNTQKMLLDSTGKLGLGVSPTYRFHVEETTAGNVALAHFANRDYTAGTVGFIRIHQYTGATTAYGPVLGANVSGIAFLNNDSYTGNHITITSGGLVGIGTATQSAKLAINGGVHVGGESDPGDNNLLVDGSIMAGSLQLSTAAYSIVLAAVAGVRWVRLCTIPSGPQMVTIVGSVASNNSEEPFTINVKTIYLTIDTIITADKGSYNSRLDEIRVEGANGDVKDIYIKVNCDTFGANVTWRALNASSSLTIRNTETTPVGATYATMLINMVSGTFTNKNIVTTNAIGIGTINPSSKLDVIQAGSGSTTLAYFYNSDYTANNRSAIRVRQQTASNGSISAYLGVDRDNGYVFLSNDTITSSHFPLQDINWMFRMQQMVI
jgi:hypothetical protein